ncbi:hypothetical protein FIBSPDRAFT_439971 [Athelia psychrophila]|uniref:Secreted protein n=1 Tax=Athelia psychrophila TaxID=1759441 RepID=A0A166MEB7_9AGAM|nr:hypothetical protein FIBSPDRAFT_439971 [Fibularhizoctonia sp. CBS 109695]
MVFHFQIAVFIFILTLLDLVALGRGVADSNYIRRTQNRTFFRGSQSGPRSNTSSHKYSILSSTGITYSMNQMCQGYRGRSVGYSGVVRNISSIPADAIFAQRKRCWCGKSLKVK